MSRETDKDSKDKAQSELPAEALDEVSGGAEEREQFERYGTRPIKMKD